MDSLNVVFKMCFVGEFFWFLLVGDKNLAFLECVSRG